MKSNAEPSIYFSAYPLKAISPETTAPAKTDERSPYLRSILSGKTRTLSRVRVFPMINPYRKPSGRDMQKNPSDRLKAVENKLPTDIELTEKEWFNNYE
ncbi:MAG TPA: hypothetical protein VLJ68_06990 [Chitinophagaceae bacterium]|nr:hypothetical protein [Chitinophagaceae bacterium]